MISIHCQISRANSCFRTGSGALLTGLLIACINLLPVRALAGGGPENVLLVVNGDSPVSLQIANTFVEFREIPQEHVLWLHDIPYPDTISIDTFRTRIWKPIREFIKQNQLDNEIDIIAYSADFPYAVDFSEDLKASKLNNLKYHGKQASLTGLTYFARHVEAGSPYYLAANANGYFRRNLAQGRYLSRTLTEEETGKKHEAEKAFRNNNFQMALAVYQELVQGFPEHGGLWHGLARCHAAVGDSGEAMLALQQAANNGWTNSLLTRKDRDLAMLSGDPAWQGLLNQMEASNGPFQAAHGFSANYEWNGSTQPVKIFRSYSLQSHYLATMLAYTGPRGNSVPEVKNYLASARSSDGAQPDGTVYLLENQDVRSKTRQPLFLETVAALERRGHRAQILSERQAQQNGILPQGKEDVIGAVLGTARFRWQSSGSQLLPGAIAESLTSYGGHFNTQQQTKLTELLRHGAAGASGAVVEPFNLQSKFPVPLLHVHYADGCSLAEAFYQSVEAPYQLLIVGDPLARPYAHFAKVNLASPNPHTSWSGVVTLQPQVVPAPGRPIGHLELWVDGQLLAYMQPDQPYSWDTRSQDDGFHDIRLVAQEAGPIETRSYARFGVMLDNRGKRFVLDSLRQQEVRHGEEIIVSGSAVRGREASIWQGNRKLASIPVEDGRWRLSVASQMLGVGQVSLGVRLAYEDNAVLRSAPLTVDITPPAVALKADRKPAEAPEKTQTVKVESNHKAVKLIKLNGQLGNLKNLQHLTMVGKFTVARSGFYELVVNWAGTIRLDIGGHTLLSSQMSGKKETRYLPLGLEQGSYDLHIELSPAGRKPYVNLVLEGDQVATIPEVKLVNYTPKKSKAMP
jgi:hypothetical protein